MTRTTPTEGFSDGDLRAYLLGTLDPESEERLEQFVIAEDRENEDSLEEILHAVEDELIDDYVRGNLDPEDRKRFQRQFMHSSERRRKIEFAVALREHVDSRPLTESSTDRKQTSWKLSEILDRFTAWSSAPARVYAMAAMLMVCLAGVTWVLLDRSRLGGRFDQVVADRDVLRQEVEGLRHQVDSMSVDPVVLKPSNRSRDVTLRSDESVAEVVLPAQPGLIRFLLDIGLDDYQGYRVVLHEYGDGEFWSQSNLRADKMDDTVVVQVTLPSEILHRGDYHFRLSGESANGDLELIGRYHFRVSQK